jgi:hypothetical protein
MKRDQRSKASNQSMPSRRLPAERPSQREPANAVMLLPCEAGTSAASMVPEAEHPRARPMVRGSMGTTARQQGGAPPREAAPKDASSLRKLLSKGEA